MTPLDQFSPQRLRDRAIILDVLHRWCRAVDRLDLTRVAEFFHPDATDDHGPYKGGIPGLTRWIEERHHTIPFSIHSLANVLIEFESETAAIVESHVWCAQRYPENASSALSQMSGNSRNGDQPATDLLMIGRYIDRFEVRDAHWRIARRTVVHDSMMRWETAIGSDAPATGFVLGKRDKSDYIYEARRGIIGD